MSMGKVVRGKSQRKNTGRRNICSLVSLRPDAWMIEGQMVSSVIEACPADLTILRTLQLLGTWAENVVDLQLLSGYRVHRAENYEFGNVHSLLLTLTTKSKAFWCNILSTYLTKRKTRGYQTSRHNNLFSAELAKESSLSTPTYCLVQQGGLLCFSNSQQA